jgi:hypothetical protein
MHVLQLEQLGAVGAGALLDGIRHHGTHDFFPPPR